MSEPPAPPDGARPLVSVVMPSFDQARWLAMAIDSVLTQDYAPLELIVVDGGSTDGSVDVLRSYGDRISWTSAPDRGQAHAVNQGFARARGPILGWLNSDDRYAPGAVAAAVAALARAPEAAFVYGEGELIDEHGAVLGRFPATQPFDLWTLTHLSDFIMQPTVFLRAARVREVGGLDENLGYGLDWDLWIRLAQRWPVAFVPRVLAATREYPATKTARGGWQRWRELRAIMRRHGAGRWPPGAITYGLDTLRRRWPTLFGPSSLADQAAQRGRLLPKLFLPVHLAVVGLIDWQLAKGRRRLAAAARPERGPVSDH